jgi:hypothetical protein
MTLQGMINNPHFNIARSAHGAKMISIAKQRNYLLKTSDSKHNLMKILGKYGKMK